MIDSGNELRRWMADTRLNRASEAQAPSSFSVFHKSLAI